ncbi:unnamed protein product [Pylaiella littoralis]
MLTNCTALLTFFWVLATLLRNSRLTTGEVCTAEPYRCCPCRRRLSCVSFFFFVVAAARRGAIALVSERSRWTCKRWGWRGGVHCGCASFRIIRVFVFGFLLVALVGSVDSGGVVRIS